MRRSPRHVILSTPDDFPALRVTAKRGGAFDGGAIGRACDARRPLFTRPDRRSARLAGGGPRPAARGGGGVDRRDATAVHDGDVAARDDRPGVAPAPAPG